MLTGYGVMKKEKKSMGDIKSLRKFISKAIFVLAFSSFLLGLSNIIKKDFIRTIALIIYTLTIGVIVWGSTPRNGFRK